ncbi:MAG TPA: rod shape-determining protein MreC [Candidatus Limnocylindrales bacterium]|nr:rod shape-determining protein MreC [Candidatus Limnocylindrales bacterium]
MTALLASRSARRRGITYVVLLAVTLVMMAFSSNPLVIELQHGMQFAFRPVQTAVDAAAGSVASVLAAIGEIDSLRSDNAQLRRDNDRLSAENARLTEIRRENEQLTGLLQLRSGFEYDTVAAQVIGRESSEFRRVVTLDKGTDDGIAVGDVVIAQGGALAGRVVGVAATSSDVLLITDTTSTVIGQLPTAATGEVVGQLGGVVIMDKIDSTEQVDPGQEVVTAGIELAGGIRSPFPKGLLIGQVVDVRRDANAVVQTAYLLPAAPLDRLEYVLVITNYTGGLGPVDGQAGDCAPQGSAGTLPNNEQPCPTRSAKPSTVPKASAAPRPSGSPRR